MSPPGTPTPTPGGLTAEERARALTTGEVPTDRAAALRAGAPPVPRRVVVWVLAVIFVFGFGGLVLDRAFTNSGAATSVPTTTLAGTGPPAVPVAPAAPPLASSLDAFIGLKRLGTAAAPDGSMALVQPDGSLWSLDRARGKVVVLTFFNQGCNDVCPVLGAELHQFLADLGPAVGSVQTVVVNTDPNHTAVDAAPAALTATGLAGQPGVLFLSGPIARLNALWADYGVTVTVGQNASQESHNDILYFIDPTGRLRAEAVPFADEAPDGTFSLPAADVQRFARGIAAYATDLLRQP